MFSLTICSIPFSLFARMPGSQMPDLLDCFFYYFFLNSSLILKPKFQIQVFSPLSVLELFSPNCRLQQAFLFHAQASLLAQGIGLTLETYSKLLWLCPVGVGKPLPGCVRALRARGQGEDSLILWRFLRIPWFGFPSLSCSPGVCLVALSPCFSQTPSGKIVSTSNSTSPARTLSSRRLSAADPPTPF